MPLSTSAPTSPTAASRTSLHTRRHRAAEAAGLICPLAGRAPPYHHAASATVPSATRNQLGGRHGKRSDARAEGRGEAEGRQGQAEAALRLQAGAAVGQRDHERARRQEGLTRYFWIFPPVVRPWSGRAAAAWLISAQVS